MKWNERHGVKTRPGNWLSDSELYKILRAPDTLTLTGSRDFTVLMVLTMCGLRRQEIARLTVNQVQDGRIKDIRCKDKTRSIKMPQLVQDTIDAYRRELSTYVAYNEIFADHLLSGTPMPLWHTSSRDCEFPSFRRMGISAEMIYVIVRKYASMCGFPTVAPHDLRRSYVQIRVCKKDNWQDIEQVMGHNLGGLAPYVLPGRVLTISVKNEEDTAK